MFTENENVQFLTEDELYETEGGVNIMFYLGVALGWAAHAYNDSQLEMTTGTGSNMRR